ncbi:MAG: acetyl-CoA carboxylase, biotin carboxyl carrier protein [Holosporales bacterium]|nr:acetyl-CoA carboxylase, biotin carboxyl carrier protein [Holosporales bacterium]
MEEEESLKVAESCDSDDDGGGAAPVSLSTACALLDKLAEVFTNNQLSEIKFEVGGCKVYLAKKEEKKGPYAAELDYSAVSDLLRGVAHEQQVCEALPVAGQVSAVAAASSGPAHPPPAIAAEIDYRTHPGTIKSPMVGVVYTAPEPGSAPFVRVGDTVNQGQTLLIVEAMKVLNPIKATKAGVVTAVLVHDQKPVEYDEPLIVIE